jgi:hypothetical protein
MPDRRSRKGSTDDFFPADILPWARETWRDRDDVAKLPNGAWMLRRAAEALGIDQEEVSMRAPAYAPGQGPNPLPRPCRI